MTRRVRNMQMVLGSNLTAAETQAIEQFAGFNMNGYKSASQTVAASTVLVNDTDIWTDLRPGAHRVTAILATPAMTAAGGLQLQWVAQDGLTVANIGFSAYFFLDATAPAVKTITALATPVNGGTTSAWTSVLLTGTVFVLNPGVLQLQWAQQAASGSTTVAVGSEIDTIQLTASEPR